MPRDLIFPVDIRLFYCKIIGMEEKALHILEYDKIIDRLAEFATSAAGRELCHKLRPSSDIRRIREWQKNTSDARDRIRLKGQALSFAGVKDIGESLKRVEVSGSLGAQELLAVSAVLTVAARAKQYGRMSEDESEDREDSLSETFSLLEPLTNVNNEIKRCILSEDEISDDASPELFSIRKKMRQTSDRIHGSINGLLNTYRDYLTDSVVTQRDGRYCLPVKAEYKSRVPGMVHDASSTGMTLFIEPMVIVNLNNELSELAIQEKKEIERVLERLSLSLTPYTVELADDVKLLRKLDMIFAKARYSYEISGCEPVFSKDRVVELKAARHPLIPKDRVVPIDLSLGKDFDLLIITGPNTGGKTVSLKTAGLLSLMGQAGLHIPAAEGSVLGVFDDVYADIGDEQSIEQSLSTFSAHMKNIVDILSKADSRSLCLFDELGSGTDPTEGAALAMAVLDFLRRMQTRTIATTHYSEIKMYALQTERVENACCEFDVETLSPTYRLLIGIPGKSNAFAISRKLGLPEYILKEAESYIAAEDAGFEDVVAKLNEDRAAALKAREETESYKKEIEILRDRLRRKEARTEESRDKILRDARAEAQRILKDAKDTADEAIKGINKLKATGAFSEAEAEREKLRAGIRKNEAQGGLRVKGPSKPVSARKLRIGDGIRVTRMGGMTGTVSTLPDKDGNLFVQLGIMKSKVNIKDIELVDEKSEGKERKQAFVGQKGLTGGSGGSGSFMPKAMSARSEVNLIGMTTDEAIPEMEKFLDDAYLGHLETVRVVHGRGTGALRDAVHRRLRKLSYVKSFRLGEYGEGDTGVTIVTFK